MNDSLKNKRRIISGAAFLSAISAFGPSLMTQIAVFSEEYGSVFLWIILLTGIMNMLILAAAWLLITGEGKTVTQLADGLFHGCGALLSALFAFCCVCFNIGNICGIVNGLGLVLGGRALLCAAAAGALCLVFVLKGKGRAIDTAVSIFAFIIIAVLVYTLAGSFSSGGGINGAESISGAGALFVPAVCMLFGSYIPFIGGQSLLSQGISGADTRRTVLYAAAASASVTLIMRLLMSLSDLAVIGTLGTLGESNPSAAVFLSLPNGSGAAIFAVIQVIISLSCVYASTECFNSFSSHLVKRAVGRRADAVLIVLCTLVIILFGRPERLMVAAGVISGMLTPLSLLVLLITGIRRVEDGRRRLPTVLIAALGIVFVLTLISVAASLFN